MKHWTDEVKNRIIELTVSGIIIATVCFAFMNWSVISGFIGKLLTAAAPFIWGFCLSFILVPLRRLIETKLLARFGMTGKSGRILSVALAVFVFLLIIALFFVILIPQLVGSFESLMGSMDIYWTRFEELLRSFGNNEAVNTGLDTLYETIRTYFVEWVSGVNGVLKTVVGYSLNIVRGILNFMIGIIVAVYLMLDQERWTLQLKKICYAFLPREHAESLFYVGRLTTNMLNNFIFGKALDSLVIGIACGLCCGVMKIPYSPLIAFIIGITNMIPIFGPFIGAIPCIFILLIISPAKAVEFGIFIVILQQVDGNILGPYILGDSMGLPPIWVMFAIIVGGTIWGILGMILGVPLFSVIYVLVKELVSKRLKEKRIKVT